jgi:hypothetical protein
MAIIRANNNTLSSVTALPFATGGFVKLLSLTGGTTSQSSYDVDSTYINSTYDNYKIIAGYTHPTDNKYAYIRFFVGGTIKEADYSYENGANTSSTYSYDAYDATSMSVGGAGGNSTGAVLETHTLCFDLTNVNSTTVATRIHGFHYGGATNANTVGYCFNCGQDTNSATDVVNGIRIYMGGDNIVMRHFAIYGQTK